jgi:hypothetical protein
VWFTHCFDVLCACSLAHFVQVPGDESKGSKISKSVCRLQQELPQARVLYCSATGVTDLSNMAFYERLGLWGGGSVFEDFETFHR